VARQPAAQTSPSQRYVRGNLNNRMTPGATGLTQTPQVPHAGTSRDARPYAYRSCAVCRGHDLPVGMARDCRRVAREPGDDRAA
jgi:hypothetical protein